MVKIRLIQVQENTEGRFCVIVVVCGSGKVPMATAVTGDGGMRGCRDGGMRGWRDAGMQGCFGNRLPGTAGSKSE